MDYKKGSKENPYSYDEYLELAAANLWTGGYVRISETQTKWVPEQDAPGTGDGSGCGSGCGSDTGSGSGSGSNDKPQYMVRSGNKTLTVADQYFSSITLHWSAGIALPHAACGSANKDGWYSDVSWELNGIMSGFMPTNVIVGYISAYEIHVSVSGLYGTYKTFYQASFTIPAIYYETF